MCEDFKTHNNKDGSMARIMGGLYVQRSMKRDNISNPCINFAK